MNRKQIIAYILFAVTIAGKLLFDLHLYYNGGVNNHLVGPAIVLICLSICTWLAGWRSSFMWLFCYWSIFDSLYGLFIHQGLLYIGTTAKLDILQHKYHIIQILKYLFALISIIFYNFKNKRT